MARFFREDPVARAWEVPGEVVRAVAGRETLRVELEGSTFYLKRHRGVGWREICKNWLVGKRPVLGARNEFEACRHLQRSGLVAPRVAAFAETDGLPGRRWSFVLCDALLGYRDLETLTLTWRDNPPDPLVRRRLVMGVADFARRFHEAGLVHRDFYICHLLVRGEPGADGLAVLDLHRALVLPAVPDRWRRRDLAALLFSTLELPLGRLSWLRFVRVYTGRPLREVFRREGRFWASVHRRALKLQKKARRKGIVPGGDGA